MNYTVQDYLNTADQAQWDVPQRSIPYVIALRDAVSLLDKRVKRLESRSEHPNPPEGSEVWDDGDSFQDTSGRAVQDVDWRIVREVVSAAILTTPISITSTYWFSGKDWRVSKEPAAELTRGVMEALKKIL